MQNSTDLSSNESFLLMWKITISGKDWDDIPLQHYLQFPDTDRNGESLKHKFYLLAKTKAQTGDPITAQLWQKPT